MLQPREQLREGGGGCSQCGPAAGTHPRSGAAEGLAVSCVSSCWGGVCVEPEVEPGGVVEVVGHAVPLGSAARRGKRLSQAPCLCRGNAAGVAAGRREPHRPAGAPCVPSAVSKALSPRWALTPPLGGLQWDPSSPSPPSTHTPPKQSSGCRKGPRAPCAPPAPTRHGNGGGAGAPRSRQ